MGLAGPRDCLAVMEETPLGSEGSLELSSSLQLQDADLSVCFLRRPETLPPHHVNRRGKDTRRLNRQETRGAGSRVLRLRSVMIPHEQKFSSLIRPRAWRGHRQYTACFGSGLSFSPLSPVVFDLHPLASGITDTPVLCFWWLHSWDMSVLC